MLRCLWRGGYGKNPQKKQRPVDAAPYSYLINKYNASQDPQTRLNPGGRSSSLNTRIRNKTHTVRINPSRSSPRNTRPHIKPCDQTPFSLLSMQLVAAGIYTAKSASGSRSVKS